MLLADLVATSQAVAATPARSAKIAALADLLKHLDPEEIEPAVSFLIGRPRQGRVGVGWRTLAALDRTHAVAPSLTIGDLDRTVATVQVTTGAGSVAARRTALTELFSRATEAEAEFAFRLLGGELRQGALDGVMAEAVAVAAGVKPADVRRAAMLAGDLPAATRLALTRGSEGLVAVLLEPLRPVLPMLASTAADVAEAIEACGLASVEWKLDGARVQAHRTGAEVRLYTRNLNDVTERLPAVADLVRSFPCDSVVLDGEVLGVGDDERPQQFQDTMSRFGRHDGSGASLGVRFFDCLYFDGEPIIDRPLTERMNALDRVVGEWRVPSVLTADPAEGEAFLADALAAGHEGVMVKGAQSLYEAGRRGKSWRKVKPVRTLDLVVLGAEWGHGRRKAWLSNLHLGARDPAGGFVMVGKTFKGLTDALLTWQTARLQELKEREEGITVYVRPELVVEVAVDGVQRSTRYSGGVALRFARIRRYRDDKSPAEADTIDDVRALL